LLRSNNKDNKEVDIEAGVGREVIMVVEAGTEDGVEEVVAEEEAGEEEREVSTGEHLLRN
jgi:hypothetical protein